MTISRRNGKHSILADLYRCAECNWRCEGPIETHEVFHGPNRRKSIQDGMVIGLCTYHHMRWHQGDKRDDDFMRRKWKKEAQGIWEENNGTREGFIKRYGKSYI